MEGPFSEQPPAPPLQQALREALAPELEIIRPLGEGRTSRVYVARDTGLGRTVAVKVLRPERAGSEGLARFEREARAVAAIEHPNVVGVHRFGRLSDGTPYLVMRHAHGRSMSERLQGEGPLPIVEVRAIIADVAGALAAAHAHGVVHRDVRPANIFWDSATGQALIGDFGVAALTEEWPRGEARRLTRTGELLGTPRYASPEQLRGDPVDEASDVYSLALVAHELLTGRVPGQRATPQQTVAARLSGRAPDIAPEIERMDPGFADLLRRCVLPDPHVRPAAGAVERAALPASAAEAEFAPPLLDMPRMGGIWRALRRRRVPEWVGAAGGGGWFLLEATQALQEQFGLPRALFKVALSTAVAVVVATGVLAWFHGERGPQRTGALERWLILAIVLGWAVAVAVTLLA
jgi:serine/threonine protein kinase